MYGDPVEWVYGKANLLVNIGPRADGSVHPEDVKALTEVGRRLKAKKFDARKPGKQ